MNELINIVKGLPVDFLKARKAEGAQLRCLNLGYVLLVHSSHVWMVKFSQEI
jgi:hypothetical protein